MENNKASANEIFNKLNDSRVIKWDGLSDGGKWERALEAMQEYAKQFAPTEDKKAPVESTPESFYERFVPYEWNEINQQTKDGILKAMQEYASQERNRAIDECIDIVKKEQLDTDDHYGYVACANILEKLKK